MSSISLCIVAAYITISELILFWNDWVGDEGEPFNVLNLSPTSYHDYIWESWPINHENLLFIIFTNSKSLPTGIEVHFIIAQNTEFSVRRLLQDANGGFNKK